MKKTIKISMFIIMALMMTFPHNAMADENDPEPVTIILNKQPTDDFSDPKTDPKTDPEPKEDPEGNRMPSRPILCTISISEGIQCDIVAEEILSYEIRTEDGICLASFTDESDFIQMLFSVPGNYQIRFLTDDYIYTGYIAIK